MATKLYWCLFYMYVCVCSLSEESTAQPSMDKTREKSPRKEEEDNLFAKRLGMFCVIML